MSLHPEFPTSHYQTARKNWNKLKERLGKEGSHLVTNCHRLKLPADDGKPRLTDMAKAETLLRLEQSVPSPKAKGHDEKPQDGPTAPFYLSPSSPSSRQIIVFSARIKGMKGMKNKYNFSHG